MLLLTKTKSKKAADLNYKVHSKYNANFSPNALETDSYVSLYFNNIAPNALIQIFKSFFQKIEMKRIVPFKLWQIL